MRLFLLLHILCLSGLPLLAYSASFEYHFSYAGSGQISTQPISDSSSSVAYLYRSHGQLQQRVLQGEGSLEPDGGDSIIVRPGEVLEGTILASQIINQGILRDATLVANAQLSGGILAGQISGDQQAPAQLSNLTIRSATVLSQVLLGTDLIIEPDVVA